MEVGYHHRYISYELLKKAIEKDSEPLTALEEVVFINWIVESFDGLQIDTLKLTPALSNISAYLRDWGNSDIKKKGEFAYKNFQKKSLFLKGSVVKQYLDYLELKESRQQAKIAQESSTKAIKIAYWSLFISAGLAITSIAISIYLTTKAPKPPFDVNVLEKRIPVKEKVQIYTDALKSVEPDNEKD